MNKKLSIILIFSFILIGCQINDELTNKNSNKMKDYKIATFAGGCFWCMESAYEHYAGVYKVISGYTGGKEKNPTYKEVSSGKTNHLEAIQVFYNPKIITYDDLLEIFWRQIDPTDSGGSFVDRGSQYGSAIFYHDDPQKKQANLSKNKLNSLGKFKEPIITEIRKAMVFYDAEDYHQDYYIKNPIRYKLYRFNSGRDQFRKKVWGDDKDYNITSNNKSNYKNLKSILTKIQYDVTQNDGTEKPFDNEYWDNHREGIYVDIVSGDPLFSSLDKFNSGTGWPSFTKPLEQLNVYEKKDKKFFISRTEIRSRKADLHLGHLFKDGPEPSGLRYCMNSAALKFIPKEDLKKEGYSKYLKIFQ